MYHNTTKVIEIKSEKKHTLNNKLPLGYFRLDSLKYSN